MNFAQRIAPCTVTVAAHEGQLPAKGLGKPCFSYKITSSAGGLNESGVLNYGDLKLLPLGEGQTAQVEIDPEKGFDFGAGPGKKATRTVKGGTVGLVLDARGRPLVLPEERQACREMMTRWVQAMGMYG